MISQTSVLRIWQINTYGKVSGKNSLILIECKVIYENYKH